jgi:predicted enzyme related to lactoylglutathione lyase
MPVLVNIDVADLPKAVAFYRVALGLRHTRTLFDATVAEMLGAGCPIYLIERATSDPATPEDPHARTYQRHWTPVHLDFVVNDIAQVTKCAVLAGAVQETSVRSFNWGKVVTLSDPFGNGFCLIESTDEPYAGQGEPGLDF